MNHVSPVIMGIVTAALAVFAQAYLTLQPPPAYGLCVVCHGRDLVIWSSATLFGTKLDVAAVSAQWPLLTVVGIFLGGMYAARSSDEYQAVWVEPAIKAFFCGMGVMIFGLLIMACPARLWLRAAYGDMIGLVGAISVLVGVVAATLFMRWRYR